MHHEEFGDRLLGVVAGFLLYSGLVHEGPHAIVVLEKLTGRQLGSVGREIVAVTVNEGIFRHPRRVSEPTKPTAAPEGQALPKGRGRKAKA